MFEKFNDDNKEPGLSNGGGDYTGREKTGYDNSSINASGLIISFKHFLQYLSKYIVHMQAGKNNHDYFIITDDSGNNLEFKDNELASIEKDLPSICLQLVLFMNAGMICTNSFTRIIDINKNNKRPIDILLRYVYYESINKNMPFENSLYITAQNIKSKCLMRFSMLILDNANKGSDLIAKLESEIDLLESSRLSVAKSKAKKAETLLCFPLMLLLISLIIICISPAFMEI